MRGPETSLNCHTQRNITHAIPLLQKHLQSAGHTQKPKESSFLLKINLTHYEFKHILHNSLNHTCGEIHTSKVCKEKGNITKH